MHSIENLEIPPAKEVFPQAVEEEKEKREEERRVNNEKILDCLYKSLNEYFNFYYSRYASHLESSEERGFSKQEKNEITSVADQIQHLLEEINAENRIDMIMDNHFKHFLGNGIVNNAGGQAFRYEKNKPINPKAASAISREMSDLNYYLKEIANDKKLFEMELISFEGYADYFMPYLKGNLPPGSSQVALFRFFRDLELGRIKKDDYDKRAEQWSEYVNLEKLRGDLIEIGEAFVWNKDKTMLAETDASGNVVN